MAALCSRCGHYMFILWFLLSPFFSSPKIGCLPYFDTWCGPSANLECRSDMCCAWLTANAGPKKSPSGHHRTTLLGYIYATKAYTDNWKKLVKQQYLSHMFPQCGELRLTSSWDRFVSLRHPCKFQQVSLLGSITARHCSSERQPNFVALNRGRYLYLAGRPSRWPLAHMSSSSYTVQEICQNLKNCVY